MSSHFADLVTEKSPGLSRTEHRVARYFADNRHQVLVQSAIELAQSTGTSDATIIRTARALGFDGLDGLRKAIAGEFDAGPTPAGRMSRTAAENAGSLELALEKTLAAQAEAIATLRDSIDAENYRAIVQALAGAGEIAVFGIGPSASMADYFCIQLRRLGFAARPLTRTGLLFADDLLQLKSASLVVIMAYGRVYTELSVLLDHCRGIGAETVLVTDSLREALEARVTRIVTVPRGRADAFSMHSATLAFLETLLVGLGTLAPAQTTASLDQLNRLRADLAGQTATLAVPDMSQQNDGRR